MNARHGRRGIEVAGRAVGAGEHQVEARLAQLVAFAHAFDRLFEAAFVAQEDDGLHSRDRTEEAVRPRRVATSRARASRRAASPGGSVSDIGLMFIRTPSVALNTSSWSASRSIASLQSFATWAGWAH